MIAFDWGAFGLGAGAGLFAGALFFAGLALGIRLAVRAARPAAVLLLSAALRIAAVLGLGWLVATQSGTALGGFALAFVMVRFVALALARRPLPKEVT